MIRAARAAGACERGISLAIETGLYAGTSATRTMASWAESEQGAAPELDTEFRVEKEKITALILAGASLAANSTELLGRYVGEAEAVDWSRGQIDAALVAAHTVSRTAATKIEATANRMGFSLLGQASDCCSRAEETEAVEPPVGGGCGCAKDAGCT
jgi:hypothetical protein